MRLAIISNVRGYSWAGSENLWHLAGLRALREQHHVTAFLHPDLSSSSQVSEFCQAGGGVRSWRAFPIARFQGIKEKLRASFPRGLLDDFDAILVSLGSLPALNYVPGLVDGLLKTRTPLVLLCQFNTDHLLINPSERAIVSKVIQKSTACVFVSLRNLQEARRQFAIEPPQAQVVLNPIRNVLEQPFAWPEATPVHFASVARFETAWKGQDLLLDVMTQRRWSDRNWELHLYGSGPDEAHLRKLTAFLGLSERVHFEGFVPDLPAIWSRNHILVLPSHGEGTPLAALEAMAYGRPVIATDVGGNAEIIQDGITGFIAEGATVRSFSATMERAWNVREHWPQIGTAAFEYVRDRITEDPAGMLLKTWMAAAAPK